MFPLPVKAMVRGIGSAPPATPTPTTTSLPGQTATPTPTPNGCRESVPPTWQPNVDAQNDVRANADPVPNPALDPYCWKATVATTAQGWTEWVIGSGNVTGQLPY